MQITSTELLAEGFSFLEGPRWRGDRLWFSDMKGGAVFTIGLDGAVEEVVAVPESPSGIGFLPDGTPLIVSMGDRRLLRLTGGRLATHGELAALVTGPINDMVVDAEGRAYVGSFGFDMWSDAADRLANIVMVAPDGAARVVAGDLAFPNGTVILAGGGTLVVAETRGLRLTAFDIAADGALSGRRLFADLGEHDPDGICLDSEGGIWVSSFSGDVFLRVLEGGEVTDRVEVPGRRAVACQLGGPDGRTLFCLTNASSWDDIQDGRGRGRIETARVAVPGAGSP
jgi:sugar lactone lactonase YvrE